MMTRERRMQALAHASDILAQKLYRLEVFMWEEGYLRRHGLSGIQRIPADQYTMHTAGKNTHVQYNFQVHCDNYLDANRFDKVFAYMERYAELRNELTFFCRASGIDANRFWERNK